MFMRRELDAITESVPRRDRAHLSHVRRRYFQITGPEQCCSGPAEQAAFDHDLLHAEGTPHGHAKTKDVPNQNERKKRQDIEKIPQGSTTKKRSYERVQKKY